MREEGSPVSRERGYTCLEKIAELYASPWEFLGDFAKYASKMEDIDALGVEKALSILSRYCTGLLQGMEEYAKMRKDIDLPFVPEVAELGRIPKEEYLKKAKEFIRNYRERLREDFKFLGSIDPKFRWYRKEVRLHIKRHINRIRENLVKTRRYLYPPEWFTQSLCPSTP